ncbi:MAG: hypothetical protein OEZ40_07330, partial [Candidatus Bathyarchaeota archaeon]|nr:hypothetical protein [Candidatus Bathyarchaeota archaeon]
YTVRIDQLWDVYDYYLGLPSSNETYLDVGTHNVSLSFNGIAIYAAEFSPARIRGLSIKHETYSEGYFGDYPLSEVYYYTLFDSGAVLTGAIYDEGADTDGDGFFNYLEVGVELNVTDAALYEVVVSGLCNVSYYYYDYIYVSNATRKYLMPGDSQILNVSLYGAQIYASHAINISIVEWIFLYVCEDYITYQLDSRNYHPLSKPYNYKEFEVLAYFTGTMIDEGIDNDMNLKFDYLQISVEINVTEPGDYYVELMNLVDDAFNYINVSETVSEYLDVGLYMINLTVYGPRIYASKIDPFYIEIVNLYSISNGWKTILIDKLSNVPLSRPYNYTEFESLAVLTGNISDRGVDVDGDLLFDYLEIEVEINVTKAGRYRVSAYGLLEQVNSTYTDWLYAYQSVEADFDVGVHRVALNYEGPKFAIERFSPTNITDISLSEGAYLYMQLDYISSAPLSTRYDYTLFNAPLEDMQVDFTVYPNGTIEVSGIANSTHMYPSNTGPIANATLSISTIDETTTGTVKGTMAIPEGAMYNWPYNSTAAALTSHYDNGILNTTLVAALLMPTQGGITYPTNASDFKLTSKYANEMLNIELWGETEIPARESMFPLNVTDFTVLAEYVGKEIMGNVTFHALPGFPIGDVKVDFSGNQTYLYLTGHINLTYGNFFDMIEINSTVLNEMLANFSRDMPGPTGLVYNMTEGLLECTLWETTMNPWTNDTEEMGADVQYNVTINGNFTDFFAKLLGQMLFGGSYPEGEQLVFAALDSAFNSVENGSMLLNYYHSSGIASVNLNLACDVGALWSKALELIPSTVPPENVVQVETWLKIANATAYAIKDVSLNASYSKLEERLDLDAWLLANITQLKGDMTPILPDAVPPEIKEAVESYLNTTYCTLTGANATFNYINKTADFEINWVLQGDFKAQLNHTKQLILSLWTIANPGGPSELLEVLNDTEVNIDNFSAELKIGGDWMYMAFDGLVIQPPKDEMDFIRFKLYRFFNMTSEDPYEPPREFEKLKIAIAAGFNGTHTILLYAPGTLPTPDVTSLDYKAMTWQNVTFSSLKDLQFRIAYQGVIDYLGKTYYVPIFTNSTASNFGFNADTKTISFNVTGTSGTGFSEITIPRALLDAAPEEWVVKIDGTILSSENFTITENVGYVFISMNYSHSEHVIEITGTWIVKEFPLEMLPLILAVLSLMAAVIVVKQRKRLGTVTAKYQSAIRTFAGKLRQLRT